MTARPRLRSAPTVPPDPGPLGAVWRRLRRLPIDQRNQIRVIDEPDGGGRVAIDCSGGVHHATVEGADLRLHDHDIDAELALLALGADLPTCLVYLAVWRHDLIEPAFLLAWGDDGEVEGMQAAREDWEGNYWESWPASPPAARALFGRRLQRSLALAAVRAEAAAGGAGDEGWLALQRATQTRARRAFVRSLATVEAHPRPDALVPVRIRMDRAGVRGAVAGRLARTGSAVDLVLPADWLDAVWRPGLAVVDDRFVLHRDTDSLAVVSWGPSGGGGSEHVPSIVEIDFRGGSVVGAASCRGDTPR